MGLKTYFPGSNLEATPTRGVVSQADVDGGIQGYSWGSETDPDAEVLPSDDLDRMEPYGFSSIPAKDTEYVEVDSTAGPCIVGFRVDCPVTLAQGESAHWHNANVYAHAKSNEYLIEATRITLGKTASKNVVLDDDDVVPNAAMDTWAAAVETALATGAPINPAQNWAATVGAAGSLGDCNASSSKTKAE